MHIFEFFMYIVLAQDSEMALYNFPHAAQEVITNSTAYKLNTYNLSRLCLSPLLRLSQVTVNVLSSLHSHVDIKIHIIAMPVKLLF